MVINQYYLLSQLQKTGFFFSDNQLTKVANTRLLVPLSPLLSVLLNALSISSIHKIQGDIVSETLIICRNLDSDSPTIPPNNLPTSNFNNGNCHSLAIAFAVRDFPVP